MPVLYDENKTYLLSSTVKYTTKTGIIFKFKFLDDNKNKRYLIFKLSNIEYKNLNNILVPFFKRLKKKKNKNNEIIYYLKIAILIRVAIEDATYMMKDSYYITDNTEERDALLQSLTAEDKFILRKNIDLVKEYGKILKIA